MRPQRRLRVQGAEELLMCARSHLDALPGVRERREGGRRLLALSVGL